MNPSSDYQYVYEHPVQSSSYEDNIYKGHSSFTVEMDELRAILKYADDNSLVLGDEICRGTETISGLSIVSQTVLDLSKKNSS